MKVLRDSTLKGFRDDDVLRVQGAVDGETSLRIEQEIPTLLGKLGQRHFVSGRVAANAKRLALTEFLCRHREYLRLGSKLRGF